MATRKNTSTPAGAKKAQDNLPSFDEVEGSELMISFKQVRGSDQLRLMGQLTKLGLLDDKSAGEEIDINTLDFEKVADLVDYVSAKFSKDPKKFDEFTSGKGGFERALNLAISYAGALGE